MYATFLRLTLCSTAKPTYNYGSIVFFFHSSDILIEFRCIAQIESNYDEVTDSFDSMNLKSELLRG